MKRIIFTAAAIALGGLGTNSVTSTDADAGRWKRCNHEGGYCNVTANSTRIRYGTSKGWATRNADGRGIWCTNEAFGRDPVPGRRKVCQTYEPDWVRCNHEGGGCTVPGSGWMLYGVGNRHSKKYFQPGTRITCSNATFGDPAPGRRKECWFWQ